jgi:predicted NAD/FAD-binding protein
MKIAVVGAGISGLASAWLLKQHEVTLFEAGDYLGGHTHTVDVDLQGTRFPVDTGFLVFNHRTYPNLTALFRELGGRHRRQRHVLRRQHGRPDLEWAGSTPRHAVRAKAQPGAPGFWRMLQDTLRFNRETAGALPELTLGDYLRRGATAPSSATGTCCRWRRRSGPARRRPCSATRSPPSSASPATTACCRSSTGRSGRRSGRRPQAMSNASWPN